MKRKHDKRPEPIVKKTPKGIVAVNASEAERIFADPIDTEYRLVKVSKRSLPQHGLYWKTLDQAVSATGKWPNAERLHDVLKLVCGYYTPCLMPDGSVRLFPGSTAFDAMNGDEFKAYFDQAMAALARMVGYDPLAFYEESAA